MDEGDEDESLFNDRNDENILDLVGTAYVRASRVLIMSAPDERVPIDENVPLEPRHLVLGRPHVHGPDFFRLDELPKAGCFPGLGLVWCAATRFLFQSWLLL